MRHTFTTYDGETVTMEFENRLSNDIAHSVLRARFVKDDMPDLGIRANFCLIAAYVKSVVGMEWLPLDETATDEQFMESYKHFAHHVDFDTSNACAGAVVKSWQRDDPIEKPDHQLTEDELADPNS